MPKVTYWALGGIALFILLTANINFINLATAQALQRQREVGVRKALGAYRRQLVGQFLSETALLVTASLLLAVVLAALTLPLIGRLLNSSIHSLTLLEPVVLLTLLAVGGIVIVLAGFYPACVLAGFGPVAALQHKIAMNGSRHLSLRKGLVLFQFVLCQLLLMGTLVIGRQVDFFRNQDLGFSKEGVVFFSLPEISKEKGQLFKQQLLASGHVEDVSLSTSPPSKESMAVPFFAAQAGMTDNEPTAFKGVDERYIALFNLQLLAGKGITQENASDTSYAVVINQAMATRLAYSQPEAAIGQTLTLFGERSKYLPIAGVVKDFPIGSKHKQIPPLVMIHRSQFFHQASVKLRPQSLAWGLAQVQKVYSSLFPGHAFRYQFLEEHLANLYWQEERLYLAFRLFAGMAIFIGCLGLYGLVSLTTLQRVKEVGIRKVLGASLAQILLLLTREYMGLLAGAFLLALPLSWYWMQEWLSDFAYRIRLSPSLFLEALAIMVAVAVLTVGYHVGKAASANPVKSLKRE